MNKGNTEQGGRAVSATIQVSAINPELKELAGDEADRLGIPLSELTVRALAQFLGRLDLAAVPRKPPGRPRNKLVRKA